MLTEIQQKIFEKSLRAAEIYNEFCKNHDECIKTGKLPYSQDIKVNAERNKFIYTLYCPVCNKEKIIDEFWK